MYTLIDVSGAAGQTSMNVGATGVDGAFVKASGANDGLYVASGYSTLVGSARSLGNVGHYFFNGPGDATAHADYFVNNLKYVAGDAVALDIEDETNAKGVKVTDAYTVAQALAFCLRVRDRLGLVPILYMSAALARGRDWSPLVAIGAKLWVAGWGANTGSPGSPPDIGSQWSEWTMWQYTSNGKVNGWPTRVDMNQSTRKISEIHHMTNSVAGAIAWARAHPTKNVGETSNSWAGWCAALVYWAGGFSRSFTTAMAAGDWQVARGRLNGNWQAAPAGAIHYWAGVGGDGHTAIQVDGSYTLLMASAAVTNSFGNAIGTVSFQQYATKGIPYRGWSMYWGDEALSGTGTAGGGGSTPLPTPTPSKEDDDMAFNSIHHPNGSISFADEFGSEDIGTYRTPDIAADEYLAAFSRIWGSWDNLTAREFDIGSAIAARRWGAKSAQIAAQVKQVDPTAIAAAAAAGAAKAVQDAIKASGVTVDLDYAKIEAAAGRGADAALADNFAAIPDAVANEAADRMKS